MIEVIDINGCPQQITDLADALEQCEGFKEYYKTNRAYSEFEKRQRAHWEDLHEKLIALQMKLTKRKPTKQRKYGTQSNVRIQ